MHCVFLALVLHADAGRSEDIGRPEWIFILPPVAESESCDPELYAPSTTVLQ